MTSQTLVRLQKEHPGYCWICGKRTTDAHTCYERVTLKVLKAAITDLDRQLAEEKAESALLREQLAEVAAKNARLSSVVESACFTDNALAALAREEARAKNKETK